MCASSKPTTRSRNSGSASQCGTCRLQHAALSPPRPLPVITSTSRAPRVCAVCRKRSSASCASRLRQPVQIEAGVDRVRVPRATRCLHAAAERRRRRRRLSVASAAAAARRGAAWRSFGGDRQIGGAFGLPATSCAVGGPGSTSAAQRRDAARDRASTGRARSYAETAAARCRSSASWLRRVTARGKCASRRSRRAMSFRPRRRQRHSRGAAEPLRIDARCGTSMTKRPELLDAPGDRWPTSSPAPK